MALRRGENGNFWQPDTCKPLLKLFMTRINPVDPATDVDGSFFNVETFILFKYLICFCSFLRQIISPGLSFVIVLIYRLGLDFFVNVTDFSTAYRAVTFILLSRCFVGSLLLGFR